MAQATNKVLQEESGEDGGPHPGIPVLSQHLCLARRYRVHQTPANFPSRHDAGRPTPIHASAVMGARTFLLGLGALCSRGISDRRINGAWLIDITSGGHCSLFCTLWSGAGRTCCPGGIHPRASSGRQCLSAFSPGCGRAVRLHPSPIFKNRWEPHGLEHLPLHQSPVVDSTS